MTIREYANRAGVHYESIRYQVMNTYKEELQEHITKTGHSYELDEWAIAFLDEHRRGNPIVIERLEEREELEELRRFKGTAQKTILAQAEELAAAKGELVETKGALAAAHERLAQIQTERLEEAKGYIAALEEQKTVYEANTRSQGGFWRSLFGRR